MPFPDAKTLMTGWVPQSSNPLGSQSSDEQLAQSMNLDLNTEGGRNLLASARHALASGADPQMVMDAYRQTAQFSADPSLGNIDQYWAATAPNTYFNEQLGQRLYDPGRLARSADVLPQGVIPNPETGLYDRGTSVDYRYADHSLGGNSLFSGFGLDLHDAVKAGLIATGIGAAVGGGGAAAGGAGGSATTYPLAAGGPITATPIAAGSAGIPWATGFGAAAPAAAGSGGAAAAGAAGGVTNWLNKVPDWVPNYLIPGVNAVLGADAAGDASDAMAGAANQAIAEQRRQYDTTRADLAPWLAAGQGALNRLNDPRASFQASPDYEFIRGEGMRGIENRFSARGGAQSGNALRALGDFTTGLAAGDFNNWFNRQAGIAGVGQNTAVNLGGLGQSAAGNIGNQLTNQGVARASGVMGRYGATSTGLQDGVYNWLYRRAS